MPPPQAFVPPSASGQHSRFREARSVLEQAIAQRAFPGAAFSVLLDRQVLALDGIGRFTYEADSPPASAASIYDLASVTKVLATTSMAMLLFDHRELPLEEAVVRWLPAFAQDEPSGGPRHRVTLRMLLAHSSGLPGYARLFEAGPDSDAPFAACLRLPLQAAPGTRAEYSDPGFILLGRILETIAGEPLDRFCAREIFEPLGMTSTCFRPPRSWAPSIPPTEEDLTFRRRIVQGEVQDENCFALGGVSGHAGLFSNALDPLRYAACLVGADQTPGRLPSGRQLFTPETIRLFTTRAEEPPGSSRALGWDTPSPPSSSGSFFSPRSAGHLGYSGTSLWIDFEARLAIVLLTNRTWPDRGSDRIRQIRPLFHDAIRKALPETRSLASAPPRT